jgi:stearoyl-CoA desaturase (delta-9 desaturase)
MNHKIKSLIVFNHCIAIVGLIYGNLWLLAASLIAFLLITKLGGEVGLHRYFSHRSFKTTRFWHYTMLILGSLNCFGPPMAWAGVHRKHHAGSDTDADPHGNQPAWKIWLTLWKPFNIEVKYIKDMLRDKEQMIMYNYYFWFIGLVWLSLFLINWQLPIFLISIPSVLAFHSAGLVNTICHITGEKLYETNDNSYNNRWVNLITLGSGLHNTHHAFPSGWDNRRNKRDIDLPAVIIKHILIKQ